MGKGRIVANLGEGLYTIEILEDRARATTARALAVERIASIDERLLDLEDEVDAAQVKVNAAIADQNEAIAQYREDIETSGSSDVKLGEFAKRVLEAASERDAIRAQAGPLRAERLGLQARIRLIDALPPLRQREAWCADYSLALTGEVATAEVPGEIGQVLVRPGFFDGAAWSASEDGAIQPALAGTPASVFYNLAMMPGWQKWRPTFRIATIDSITEDLCDITLVPATSSQQGLSVNAQATYSDVPIYYMDCNGAAFLVGDRVLVAFSGNTGQPMVVGFETEPRECGLRVLVNTVNEGGAFGVGDFFEPATAGNVTGYLEEVGSSSRCLASADTFARDEETEQPFSLRWPCVREIDYAEVGEDSVIYVLFDDRVATDKTISETDDFITVHQHCERGLVGSMGLGDFEIFERVTITIDTEIPALMHLNNVEVVYQSTTAIHAQVDFPVDGEGCPLHGDWTGSSQTKTVTVTDNFGEYYEVPINNTLSNFIGDVEHSGIRSFPDPHTCIARVDYNSQGLAYITCYKEVAYFAADDPDDIRWACDLIIARPDGVMSRASYSNQWPAPDNVLKDYSGPGTANLSDVIPAGQPINADRDEEGNWFWVYA